MPDEEEKQDFLDEESTEDPEEFSEEQHESSEAKRSGENISAPSIETDGESKEAAFDRSAEIFKSDEVVDETIDYTLLFRQLKREIEKQGWFNDLWDIYQDGAYLHIFKRNWFDDGHNGIHFEVYVDDEGVQKKNFPIMLHMEADVPERDAFRDAFFVAAAQMLKKFPEYAQNINEYTLLKKEFPLNIYLIQKVLDELDKLSLLAKPIDQALRMISDLRP